MPVSEEFLEFVLDQLSDLGEVTARKMFGGAGIYCSGKMFGLIANDVAYLKADEQSRPDYEDRGCGPFKPWEHKKMTMPYYEIPPEVLEDAEELAVWAGKSLSIALEKD
jgi:DNA transformation protein